MLHWIERTEEETKNREQLEQQRKQKILENQQFLRDQMQQAACTPATLAGQTGSEIKERRKHRLGGMMNPEEARMNRALLQEIARVKRGEEPTGVLAQQTSSPI